RIARLMYNKKHYSVRNTAPQVVARQSIEPMLLRGNFMRTFRLIILLLILITAFGGPVSAQDDEGIARVEIVEIVAEDLPQVTLLVNVFDAFEVPVPDLTTEHFAITADGQPATITDIQNVTRDELPISVVLV